MDPVKRSLWSLHGTVAILGATALFAKLIPLSATDITFGRALVSFIVLTLLVKLSGGSWRLRCTRDYLVALILGVLMTAHWVTYFAAMQYASVSIGMIALFTFPVISVLLEPLFEKNRLAWQDLLSSVVVLLGIYLITPVIDLGDQVFVGVVLGLFSALLYAIRNLCHRRYFAQYSGAQAMSYQTLIIFVCLLFFISPELPSASSHTWMLVVVLGIAFTALPHTLIASSLKHLRVKTFSLVSCVQPLWGVFFAMLILGEQPSMQTLLGGILVMSAAIYETLHAQRKA